MITSGLRALHARRGHAEHVEVLAQRREERALHPLLLDAQHHDDVGVARPPRRPTSSRARRAARCPAASASAARRPTRRRRAWSAAARSTAARGCAADRRRWRPSARRCRFLCSRIVNASSSACVGCSCMPSPALMMRERQMRDSRWHAPDEAWRSTIMSGAIASMFMRGVGQRLALQHARRGDGDVQRVGAQPLLRDLERGARARARLVEQVDDGLAAQRRHLLDRPLRRSRASPRPCRESR